MQLLLLSVVLLSAARPAASATPATVHTIFSTECNPYFDWCAWFFDYLSLDTRE